MSVFSLGPHSRVMLVVRVFSRLMFVIKNTYGTIHIYSQYLIQVSCGWVPRENLLALLLHLCCSSDSLLVNQQKSTQNVYYENCENCYFSLNYVCRIGFADL